MKNYSGQAHVLREAATFYKNRPGVIPYALVEQLDDAANAIDELLNSVEDLRKAGAAMHTWIFLNTGDEQKVYDEIGLTDEQNALFGYGGQFVLRTDRSDQTEENATATNNKVNLCDSCRNNYPECNGDVLFGDGVGNDNICCCNCYNPLQTKGAG